ncbi:hypothetical protein [Brevibacillus laterosporus]|uniref:hypothetical protein n=1 Tax=Brevibacillus laterosporus TaxID=1465 RepID=UPI00215CE86C|nr:hypothetical protein [Brevibacillus laterosporus]MCR8994653.1 hypothetical protein [Brevibacillus laterosporus]
MPETMQMLNMELIEQASDKYANIRNVVIQVEMDGQVRPFIVEMYKHFSPVSIKNCVKEFVDKMDMVRARDKDGFGDIMMPYLTFLIIRHFTTLEFPHTFAKQLKAIEHMLNTGIMFQILMHFDEKEVKKVHDELDFILKNFDSKLPEIESLKKQIKEKLTDKTLVD